MVDRYYLKGRYFRGKIFSREDIFAGRYFRGKIFSREDIFAGRYFRGRDFRESRLLKLRISFNDGAYGILNIMKKY